jgi:transcriptional regulator with XRE-family HTH domain
MINYFSDFVKQHGGDDSFSNSVGVTRQTIGNIKRGRNKATEKVIKKIEELYPDFDRTLYLSFEGANNYLDKIKTLEKENEELKIEIRVLKENQTRLIESVLNAGSTINT